MKYTEKKLTVGLMGHSFQCSNLGVGALALSECALLKRVAERAGCEVKAVCFEAGAAENNYIDVSTIETRLEYCTYSPQMIGRFKKCDFIIDATGGDSFSDIYGLKVFTAIMLMKIYSLMSGRKVVAAPQTIGPFSTAYSKLLSGMYLSKVKKIFLRDTLSLSAIGKKYQSKVTSVADMAFALPYIPRKKDKNVVGFNVSGLLYDESNSLVNRDGFSYKRLCERIIECLFEKGYKVELVPHVIGDETTISDNDYCASLLLKEKYPELLIAPRFTNPVEAKSYISGYDFFIGSRMHAVIAAISSGVTALPIAYSRKFRGVFEPLGYRRTVDATRLSEDEVLKAVQVAIEDFDALSEECKLVQSNAEEKLKVYEDYLVNVFEEILA